jgi:hypothetical protein
LDLPALSENLSHEVSGMTQERIAELEGLLAKKPSVLVAEKRLLLQQTKKAF